MPRTLFWLLVGLLIFPIAPSFLAYVTLDVAIEGRIEVLAFILAGLITALGSALVHNLGAWKRWAPAALGAVLAANLPVAYVYTYHSTPYFAIPATPGTLMGSLLSSLARLVLFGLPLGFALWRRRQEPTAAP